MTGAAIGALVGASFGGCWAIAGAFGLPKRMRPPVILLSLAVTAFLIARPFVEPLSGVPQGSFDATVYWIAVAAETAAILIAAIFLNVRGRKDLLLPVIGIIVGLHFIGLWQATRLLLFLGVAILMCAVSLAALLLRGYDANGVSPRQAVAGLGCAIVLWGCAALTLF